MLDKLLLNLQLFADGGDGGSAGEGEGGETSGAEVPAFIPEKAKKHYQTAMEKMKATSNPKTEEGAENQPPNDSATTEPQKLSYADLIKSEDYKDEHKAYMEKVIGDRLKKYKETDSQNAQMRQLLETVGNKYGIDATSEDFLTVLAGKIDADDSYYEKYAVEHDVSPEEARRIVTLERRVRQAEEESAQRERIAEQQRQIQILRQNAEQTKSRFPGFDLDREMQDEKFRRLCAVNNGDTTAAYMACHWEQVIPATMQTASRQIAQQTANAVSANMARPVESGLSSNAPSVVAQDFRNMNLQQIRAYADEQRRKIKR